MTGLKGRGVHRRLGFAPGSFVLASLLFSDVAFSMAGARAAFLLSVVVTWIVLPAIVGLRNVLDAGCFFMLLSLGIVVVDVAQNGLGSLLA